MFYRQPIKIDIISFYFEVIGLLSMECAKHLQPTV